MQIRPTIPTSPTIPGSVMLLVVALATSCRSAGGEAPDLPSIPDLDDLRAASQDLPEASPEKPFVIDAAAETDHVEGAEELSAFLRYCERELLVRAPRHAARAPGGPASAWFGELVQAKDGVEGAAVAGLATFLYTSFAVETPDAGAVLSQMRVHVAGLDDEWVVPRYALLEKRVGDAPFREALRALVDRHRGGPPIGVAEVADVFEETTGEGAFVRTWLSGPERPSVQTQWRYDEARERVLLRIDQVHEVEGGVPVAFPFKMPLRILFKDGRTLQKSVEVQNRREVLSVDSAGVPASVTFDPDFWLEGMVEFVDAPGR